MLRTRLLGTVLLLTSLVTDGSASAETVQDFRTWINLTVQGHVHASRFRLHLDIQERNRDGVEEIDQLLVRPGIGYALDQRSSVWVGYAYIATFPPGGGVLNENRAWQQYLWAGPIGSGTLTARSRLEQRFIEGAGNAVWRVRQLLRYQRPFKANGSVAPVVWDEVFVQLNSNTRARSGLDQNRGFVGVGITLSPKARVEMGYMNQFINGVAQDRMNHVLSGVVTLSY
jgi:uncharacterized protein DUF2490